MSGTRVMWGQLAAVFFVILTGTWAATEWTAWRLAFQPQLGQPWLEVAGWPLYPPPAFFWWWFAFDAYAPRVFLEASWGRFSSRFTGRQSVRISSPP